MVLGIMNASARTSPSELTIAAFVLPGVEQVNDDLLHLLRGVVLGKIPLHVLLIEEELLPLVGLFLGEQMMQVFPSQSSRLAHLLEGTGLGEGRGGLAGVHFFLKHSLVFLGQIGNLHCRIEGNLVFVYHLEDGRNQMGQTDVALDGAATFIYGLANYICRLDIPDNLSGILAWPTGLPSDGFHLHLIGKRLFAGQDMLPLDVAVHHQDHRLVVGHIPDQYRQFGDAQSLAGSLAAVSADDLVATIPTGPDQQR